MSGIRRRPDLVPVEVPLAVRVLSALPGVALVVNADGVVEQAFGGAELVGSIEQLAGRALHEVVGIVDEGAAGLMQIWLASVVGHDAEIWSLYLDQAPVAGVARGSDGSEVPLALDAVPLVDDGRIERVVIFVRATSSPAQAAAAVAVASCSSPSAAPAAADVETFRSEAAGLLSDCDAALGRLELDPAARHAVNRMFRSLHTLKGTARAFGFASVQAAAHETEDLLAKLRDLGEPVPHEQIVALGKRLRALRQLVDGLVVRAAPSGGRVEPAAPDELETFAAALDTAAGKTLAAETARQVLGRLAQRFNLDPELARALAVGEVPPAIATGLRSLVAELRRCELPDVLAREVEACLAALRATRGRDGAEEAIAAIDLLAAAAAALGVPTLEAAAMRAIRGLAESQPGMATILGRDEHLAELEVVARAAGRLSRVAHPPERVDVLALAQTEARHCLVEIQRALEVWSAFPRGEQARRAANEIWRHARRFRACATRYGLLGLAALADEIQPLVDEARSYSRPPRGLMARIERWVFEVEAQLALYQTFSVELAAAGSAEAEVTPMVIAVGRATPECREEPLLALREAATAAGILSIGAAMDSSPADAAVRIGRLAIDLPHFVAHSARRQNDRRAALASAAQHYEHAIAGAGAAGQAWRALRRAIAHVTLEPLTAVAESLQCVAAEAAHTVGREVQLSVDCDDVCVEPEVARRLDRALMHAVRNAVDHGIEPPDERLAAGKPACGSLWLVASEGDDLLRVELSDDGRGVDLAEVRARAVDKGLISPAVCAVLDDAAVLQLLFHPGFTTRTTVTALSGRGVGLDAVRSTVEELGGSVVLESQPGRGCRLIIELPRRPHVVVYQ
jgi:two-component system chemotaxis sensor kinase CheA